MTAASREDIVELIGDVADELVDRIRKTGASVSEIAEAIDELEDRNLAKPRPASSPRVIAVREILEVIFAGGKP